MIVSAEAMENLKALGGRLREERLRRNETQQMFAARIGTSVPTLLKMEAGDHRVQMGFWVAALDVLGRESELSHLLATQDDLFARYEQSQKPRRQRASRRKAP